MNEQQRDIELWGDNYNPPTSEPMPASEDTKPLKSLHPIWIWIFKIAPIVSILLLTVIVGISIYIFVTLMPHRATGLNPFVSDSIIIVQVRELFELVVLWGTISLTSIACLNIASLFYSPTRKLGVIGLILNLLTPLLVGFAWLVLIVI